MQQCPSGSAGSSSCRYVIRLLRKLLSYNVLFINPGILWFRWPSYHRNSNSEAAKQTVIQWSYGSSFGAWPVNNLAELAGEPTSYMRCQASGYCFATFANPPSLSLHLRLAPSLSLENPTCQKLKHEPCHVLPCGYDVIFPVGIDSVEHNDSRIEYYWSFRLSFLWGPVWGDRIAQPV
jgi:hypothetical protein